MGKIWKEASYRSGKQKEKTNNEWASQPEKLYIRWKNWGHRACLPFYIPVHCTLRCEQGAEHLCLYGSCSAKPFLISSARHSSIHCGQAHMDKHSKENIFKNLPAQTVPAQQHLEMLWKYILKNIFCFVLSWWLCRLCQMCLLPTAKNATCDKLLISFWWRWTWFQVPPSFPFQSCWNVLVSSSLHLLHSSPTSEILRCQWFNMSATSPTSQGTVSSLTGIQNFISSEFSSFTWVLEFYTSFSRELPLFKALA